MTARGQVRLWNERNPVGTLVKVETGGGGTAQTRTGTRAFLVGEVAVVALDGLDVAMPLVKLTVLGPARLELDDFDRDLLGEFVRAHRIEFKEFAAEMGLTLAEADETLADILAACGVEWPETTKTPCEAQGMEQAA